MARPLARFPALLVCVAVAAALWGLWQWLCLAPDETNRLRDDAFYEFVWAANVAAGRGPTVSDGVTTSGVQWLWSLLLVPLAWLLGPAALPIGSAWLGFALHVATAVLWWRSQRDRLSGLVLGLLWLGHPLLLREAQNGQETALACLLASALVLGWRTGEVRFACLGVLAVLARSDLLPLVAALSFLRHRSEPVWGLPAPLLAFAVPLVGNLAFGGGFLPDSALPMAWLWHQNQAAADPSLAGYLSALWWYTRPVLLGGPFATASMFGFALAAFLLIRPWWPRSLRALPALVVGLACAMGARDLLVPVWTALLLVMWPAPARRRLPLPLACIVFALSAIVLLHWPVRWYPRDYYLAPLVVAAFAAVARVARLRVLLLAFAVLQVIDSRRVAPEPLAGQREMSMAGRFLHEVLPANERVGCFNSGIVTFYADVLAADGERRGIVNLDGVVDSRSFAALRQGRLSSWLDEQGVRFVLDNPVQFERDPTLAHACGSYFGPDFDAARDLVEIARFDVPTVGQSMRLYWRCGRGDRPPPAIAPGDLRSVPRDVPGDGPHQLWWGARAGESLVAIDAAGQRQVVAVVEVDTVVLLELGALSGLSGRSFAVEAR